MPKKPPRMAFQIFWPGTSTMAMHRSPSPASNTLGSRLGVSARRLARRDVLLLPRDADDRLDVLRERDEPLRLDVVFRFLF